MGAKRHHYVPQFLLERFSERPGEKGSLLWRLNKKGGPAKRVNPRNVAVIRRFYEVLDREGQANTDAEEALAKIEGYTANLISRLVAGESISEDEQGSLAIFVALAHFRTPLGRQWIREMAGNFAKAQMRARALYKPAFDDLMEKVHPEMPEDERQKLRDWTLEELDDAVDVEFPQTFTVVMVLRLALTLGGLLHDRMHWIYVRAPKGSGFVISDTPVAIYDPTGAPSAPFSSPDTETTLPLDPALCLTLLQDSPGAVSEAIAKASHVDDLNLRTYAWADQWILGPSQASVTDVRRLAKKNKHRLAEVSPRPPEAASEVEWREGKRLMRDVKEYRLTKTRDRGRSKREPHE